MSVPEQVAGLGISAADWEQTPASARAALLAVLAQVAVLTARVAALTAEVEQLREQLDRSSRNSSRPPSTDAPQVRAKRNKKKRSKRRRGGQPGHKPHERALVPVDQVDEVVVCRPETCEKCAASLVHEDPEPRRHQVFEVPRVKPHVTEFQVHARRCDCGHITRGRLPVGVGKGAFGPRLQAIVAACSGIYHLSRRTVVGLMEDLFGVQMSLGSVVNCEQSISEALEGPVAEAHDMVEAQAVAHADETGWRQQRRRAWLWVAVTASVVVFLVHLRRSAVAARQLLGGFKGILVTDRWSAYGGWHVKQRQLCWSHLLRDFEAMAERRGRSRRIGKQLVAQAQMMFHWWHRVRDGTMSRATFQRHMPPIQASIEALLAKGLVCGHRKTEGTCRELLQLRPALWTFVRVEGVEPSNNAAEQALRTAVLWRKNSFGCDSDRGSRFVERMLTTAATLKRQNRHLLDFLVQLRTAAAAGQPLPSLLPPVSSAPALAA